MRLINWLLQPFGVILLPRTSAKMLTESANIVETYWNHNRPSASEIIADLTSNARTSTSVEEMVDRLQGKLPRMSRTVLWLRNAAEAHVPDGDEYK